MSLSQEFLDILRCSESKQELIYFPDGDGDGDGDSGPCLFCPKSRLRYPIDEHGIPVMLVEDARRLSAEEAEKLIGRARELNLRIPGDA